MPILGNFSLIVGPIVGWAHLVLMDGGSGLNVLYANKLDHMGIPRESLNPNGAPFFRIIPRVQAIPLGSIQPPITFGATNFRKDLLDFEVVDLSSLYHALLG